MAYGIDMAMGWDGMAYGMAYGIEMAMVWYGMVYGMAWYVV